MTPRIETIGDARVAFVNDDSIVTIYSIRPGAGEPPVYVGSTAQKLRLRIRAHMREAKAGSPNPVHLWLRGRRGFCVEVLEAVPASRRAECERHWVASFPNLLNLTDGGPGMSGHRFAGTEHAQRIAQSVRTAPRMTCEQCGASFHKKVSQIRKTARNFCSRGCYAASIRKVAA